MKLTGWTVDQIDATTSDTLDWLLAIDRTVRKAEYDAEREAQRKQGMT